MQLNLVILLIFIFLLSFISGIHSSCKKRSEVCWVADDCCSVKGTRMLCGEHLDICGKKRCCITEIEEQQEKQAAIIRNRVGKSKRLWKLLFDEDKE